MIASRSRPDPRQRQAWLHQLGLLLQAGIDLHQGLRLLELQQPAHQQAYWAGIRAQIEAGHGLASSLAQADLLPAADQAMLASAEQTGGMDRQLLRVAARQRQRQQQRQRIRQATRYPLLLLLVATLVSLWLITYLVPGFASLYASLGAELPAATRLLLRLAAHLTATWPVYLTLLLGLGGLALLAWRRLPGCRRRLWRLAWHLPGLHPPVRALWLSGWHAALGDCLQAGLPYLTALACAQATTGDSPLQAVQGRLAQAVAAGHPLSAPLSTAPCYPAGDVALIRIGEHTGRLSELLLFLADQHARQAEDSLNQLTRLIEPLLMALIGLLIGSIVLALYLPLFQLGQVL